MPPGRGVCPEDEGIFHDAVTAPAAHIGITSSMLQRYSVEQWVRLFAAAADGALEIQLPDIFRQGFLFFGPLAQDLPVAYK